MSFVREPNAEPIPGYRLIEPLGSGGFGEVWKCEAPGGILKAMKFVFGNLNSLDNDGAAAEQEHAALNAVKGVRHPFVLSMDLFKVVDGELVIVMELADKSLQDVFDECKAAGMVGIPRHDLLRYLRDAAEALDHMLQKHHLLHLDVKPRNLFLISDRVKVADFGLVKSLERQGGLSAGVTPLYAPPETYVGKISEQSDQYSLAIVYQEMLSGQRPFNGKNARQLMLQHTKDSPELRSLPEAERPVVARALAKDPSQRFPDCMSFMHALYRARTPLKAEEILAGKDSQRPRTLASTMEDLLLMEPAIVEAPGAAPADGEGELISTIGITAQAPQTGSLRPTLIIGVGGFSRRAVTELRCRLLDRFGDLGKLPLLRFLYLDSDADSLKESVRGTPEVACNSDELFHLALQPIANYRRRMLEHINEWLPHEKLYCLPRSLQTVGVRALGRLAYVDHQQRLLAKVKREIQRITHPDVLYQSVGQTGLALRDGKPRIYVIAAAGGGGSGLLPDLGIGLRRLLQQLRYHDAEVTALVFCGAPDDPATPRPELANIYGTLTEINHYSDPDIPFSAQYGADGQRVTLNGPAFHQIYLLKQPHRTPEGLRDAVAHLGSYLFHELTTPLGVRLDACRHQKAAVDATRFRSFGTYAVWFPCGLLLRLAGRQACRKLLQEWQDEGAPTAPTEVESACARSLDDPQLHADKIAERVRAMTAAAFGGDLKGALNQFLLSLDEQSLQSAAQDNPAAWAKQTMIRIQEWVGPGHGPKHEKDLQKSRLSRALNTSIQKLAEDWEKRLADVAFALMDHPGRRVAAADAAFNQMLKCCQDSADQSRGQLEQHMARTQEAAEYLDRALGNCITGQGAGFSLFGGKSRKLLRAFMEQVHAFCGLCLEEGISAFTMRFYTVLRGRLDDRKRELSFCRQRLRAMHDNLDAPIEDEEKPGSRFETELPAMASTLPSAESYWDAIRESETARLVLPHGETDLEQAAEQFLLEMTEEQWRQLGQRIQEEVMAPLGGLYHICVTNADLARALGRPLLLQIIDALTTMLPVTDVAQVEMSAAENDNVVLESRIKSSFERAMPLVVGKDKVQQHAYLLIPASDAGKVYSEAAVEAAPDVETVRVAGQAHLMFCREQGYLTPEELRSLIRPCRQAYEELNLAPNTSPHARFDVTDWVPIDP